jgi:hypothetical protein
MVPMDIFTLLPSTLANFHPLKLTVADHFGLAKTLELLSRDYHWPRMRHTVRRFIANCDTCSRAKPSRLAPYGPLQPLPVP